MNTTNIQMLEEFYKLAKNELNKMDAHNLSCLSSAMIKDYEHILFLSLKNQSLKNARDYFHTLLNAWIDKEARYKEIYKTRSSNIKHIENNFSPYLESYFIIHLYGNETAQIKNSKIMVDNTIMKLVRQVLLNNTDEYILSKEIYRELQNQNYDELVEDHKIQLNEGQLPSSEDLLQEFKMMINE